MASNSNNKNSRSSSSRDIISGLPSELLCYIFCFLPFKEAARTSILSTRFRHVWRGTTRINFQENFFVKDNDTEENKQIQRRDFIDFTYNWLESYTGKTIDLFSLTFSRPGDFPLNMHNFIRSSLAHNVKGLSLDFHDPIWREDGLENRRGIFELPLFVYDHKGLESLKLFSCNFLVSGFRNFTSLKELSLGWIQLGPNSVKNLLMYCPLLESFTLKNCWNIHEHLDISGPNRRLQSLVVDKCKFSDGLVQIQAPNLMFFKYSGRADQFYVEEGLTSLQEAEIDFGLETEFSELGHLLYNLLEQLFAVRVLTVCSYLLQSWTTGKDHWAPSVGTKDNFGKNKELKGRDLREEISVVGEILRDCLCDKLASGLEEFSEANGGDLGNTSDFVFKNEWETKAKNTLTKSKTNGLGLLNYDNSLNNRSRVILSGKIINLLGIGPTLNNNLGLMEDISKE
ncbi:hypothetical protein LWI28_022657 [Acer negundo]|uniref:F-box domain-containing protein n=1 Tax=Acer negundo TaxID=4023 RepID=A0AAD5J715_ACENE|nr:hypothetical protein LWI28_022657 [Acer negundo]